MKTIKDIEVSYEKGLKEGDKFSAPLINELKLKIIKEERKKLLDKIINDFNRKIHWEIEEIHDIKTNKAIQDCGSYLTDDNDIVIIIRKKELKELKKYLEGEK